MGDEKQTDLRGISRRLFSQFCAELRKDKGVRDSVRLYEQVTGLSSKGVENFSYYKELPDYEPAEGEPSPTQSTIAALLDLPPDEQTDRMRQYFEEGPYFELLSYHGVVDVLVSRSVDLHGCAETALDVVVDEKLANEYARFLDSLGELPYAHQFKTDLMRVMSSEETYAARSGNRVRLKVAAVANDLEGVEEFVVEQTDFS